MEQLNSDTVSKYKICVSGAAETGHCGMDSFIDAEKLGYEIAQHNAILTDGATTGFPYWAAKGAKKEGGMVIGFSPAATSYEHTEVYGLPTDYHDVIFYLGTRYSMRNLILIRSSDAVVFGCGRIGTINEFTNAFEEHKPIGILEGAWETDELFKQIIKGSNREHEIGDKIVYDTDPKALIEKLIDILARDVHNTERLL
ncbi:MAG: hypothetical protein V1652_00100 [bacterium]